MLSSASPPTRQTIWPSPKDRWSMKSGKTQDQTPDSDKEEEAFTSVKMFESLQPRALWSVQETEDNVRRLDFYLNEYPYSVHAKRVRFDLAAISFPMVEALYPEAYNDERANDTNSASSIKMKAQTYFQMTQSLTNELYEDSAAGIGPGDVFDTEADLLHGYCLEKDYAMVLDLAGQWASNSTPGGLTWLMAKTYRGAAFQGMIPADLKKAARELDEALQYGLTGKAENDHWVLAAASFRISVARQAGDFQKAIDIYRWVQASKCKKDQKKRFLGNWAFVLRGNDFHP